jgi:hypothetical protein
MACFLAANIVRTFVQHATSHWTKRKWPRSAALSIDFASASSGASSWSHFTTSMQPWPAASAMLWSSALVFACNHWVNFTSPFPTAPSIAAQVQRSVRFKSSHCSVASCFSPNDLGLMSRQHEELRKPSRDATWKRLDAALSIARFVHPSEWCEWSHCTTSTCR